MHATMYDTMDQGYDVQAVALDAMYSKVNGRDNPHNNLYRSTILRVAKEKVATFDLRSVPKAADVLGDYINKTWLH